MIMNDTLLSEVTVERPEDSRIVILYNFISTIFGVNITINGTFISGDYI
jgi:hypothetical protein